MDWEGRVGGLGKLGEEYRHDSQSGTMSCGEEYGIGEFCSKSSPLYTGMQYSAHVIVACA